MTRTWLICARVLTALAVVLAWAGAAARATTFEQGTPPADRVSAEVRRYFEAVSRNDVAALESLLASDYAEVSPLGQVDTRAHVVEFYRLAARAQTGQTSEVSAVAIDDLAVKMYGDVAVAIVGESFKMTVAGSPVARPMRSTLVWRRAGGTWKLVSSHHTVIGPPIGPGSSVDR